MRVYNRADFLKLPEGTVYCAGEPWAFQELSVKGETLPYNDFVRLGLQWVEAADSGEATDRLDAMLAEGASFPMQSSYGRDGGFDDDEVYLVYESADLAAIEAICAAARQSNESVGKDAGHRVSSTHCPFGKGQ